MKATLPKDVFEKLYGELNSLPDHPRVLITLAHCYLELFVHLMAVSKCKNGKRITDSNRDYPHSIKIVMLHEAGLISDWESQFLHWFRKQRNKAAHEVEFDIAANDLEIFRGHTEEGDTQLDDPKNIRALCEVLIMGFWNKHIDVFGPIFAASQEK